MTEIKIFVSHRIDLDSNTINCPLYVPIRCGAIYDKRNDITMIGDDTGDNISEKRLSFCELTVQYWAWKNVQADYYGLCHYRRYLSFSDYADGIDIHGRITEKYIGEDFEKKYGIDEKKIKIVCEKSFVSLGGYKLDKALDDLKKLYVEDKATHSLTGTKPLTTNGLKRQRKTG